MIFNHGTSLQSVIIMQLTHLRSEITSEMQEVIIIIFYQRNIIIINIIIIIIIIIIIDIILS